MLRGEVICNKEDKEKLLYLINEIKKILDKYPYSSDYSVHTVTGMCRAKNSCSELQRDIETLYIAKDKF